MPTCLNLTPTQVLRLWEEACALVLQREELLSKLEQFEEKASDPARHFVKGIKCRGLFPERAMHSLNLHRSKWCFVRRG